MKINNMIYNIVAKVFVFALFSLSLIFGCANPLAPTGGPKDSLPPKVMAYTPEYGATNFAGKRIAIEFDEYMVLKNQQTEFYISPFTSIKPTVSMRGRSLVVEFQDSLAADQTYVLNFGNSITDNNEGNVLFGFRYVFSTGATIDSMVMSGMVVDAVSGDSVSSAFIMYYDMQQDSLYGSNADSLLLKASPRVVARTQTYGGFIAENLKPVDYRVFAFSDVNSNQMYDPGVDKVGFVDSLYNPETSPEFTIWYDTTRKYMVSEPQIHFSLFKENTFTRQYLIEKTRPLQHQIILDFADKDPIIDSIGFDSVAFENIIFENLKDDKDSIALWLNVPSEELPDTLRGKIITQKNDTLNVLRPDTQLLELVWRKIDTRSRREQKAEEKDTTLVENPFKFTVEARSTINPLKHIPFKFEYPLSLVDTARISLIREAKDGAKYKVRYSFENDSTSLRNWTIKAQWRQGEKYTLDIPSGAIINIANQSNDSLKANFSIESADKYSSLVVNIKGETPESTYILELLDSKSKVLETRKNVKDGKQIFEYLTPGTVILRFIQDENANGKWDTGSLVEKKQSERVELFYSADGDFELTTKANWEMEFDVDLKDVFYPLTSENIRAQVAKKQKALQRKASREKADATPQYQPVRGEEGHEHEHGEKHE